jgi:hypothetical protein
VTSDGHPAAPDQEQERERPPQDPFSLQFSRLVRVSGLLIAFHEAFFAHSDRTGLLTLSAVMMSGSLLADAALRRVLRSGGE